MAMLLLPIQYHGRLSHGTKESAVKRCLRLHGELIAADEAEKSESQGIVVPETVPSSTMAVINIALARYQAGVQLNQANPVATAQSVGADFPYSNPDANVNAEADPEGVGNIVGGADVDVAEGEDEYEGDHDGDRDPFTDAAVGDDDDESSDDDADPLNPFHPCTFSGSDAAVETLHLYGKI
jgi:hypothetical protein